MRWSAMSDSGKRCPIFVKKARNSRRKRLNIQRMGSVQSVENFDPAIGGPVAGHGTANNICGVIEEGASSEQNIGAGEGSKASDGADNQSTVVGAPATADEVPENSTCSSHGWFSMMGRRRVMEDTVMVAPGAVAPYDFFAVYDGHGGARVALACRERMHKLLVKEIEGYADGGGGGGGGGRSSGGGEEEMIDWEKVMVACFAKMDGEVRGGGGERVEMEDVASAGQMIGSTAVVVVVGKEEVVTANCGDSRAVLCRGGVAVPLSCDHKPDRPDERERVEAAGGRIINWNGSRVLGVLATSRSIGDQYLRPYVIPIPEVTVSKRTDLDEFLVIASDGLWDVVSNEVACEVTKRCLCGQIRRRFLEGLAGSCAADAAAVLAELAMVRGSKDNISVIVVELKKTSHIV